MQGHLIATVMAGAILTALLATALMSRLGRFSEMMGTPDAPTDLDVPILMVEGYERMVPVYATPDAAGCDLMAAIAKPVTLMPGERRGIDTGVRIELPEGYEAQIRPRSGLAFRHGIGMVNAPGTIDHGYRGIVTAILVNHGSEPFVVEPGARIAQMVVAPVTRAAFRPVAALSASERGERGFGSTGTGAVTPRAP